VSKVAITKHALERAKLRIGRRMPRGADIERWLEWEIAAAFEGGHFSRKLPRWACAYKRSEESRLFVKLLDPKCCLVVARQDDTLVLVTVLLPLQVHYGISAA
jgi:hypothetical protein